MEYNIIAIGGGSAGLVSAYIAAAVKAKVALVEKHKMGGDCLNKGCVPSKALIRTASLLSMIKRHKEFGLKSAKVDFNFSEIMERIQRVIKKIEPHDSVDRYTALGVECFQGEAKVLSPHKVQVKDKILTTKNIILATGASPFIPPIPGLGKVDFLHTDNVWQIRKQPQRLVILGGGPIGSELAQSFHRLGTKVILIEMMPQILIREDNEVIETLTKRFVEEGVELHMNTKAVEVIKRADKKFVIAEQKGKRSEIEFDEILVAVGRKPNVKGFGLEELGIKLTDRGAVAIGRVWANQYSQHLRLR